MSYMVWICRALLAPFHWIIWILAGFIPKKEICIYGSWFGKVASDNSWYLFLQNQKDYPEYEHYFITEDKSKYLVKNVVPKRSLKSIIISTKAKYAFYSSSIRDLPNFYLRKSKRINLWHGIPIKKIGLDNQLIYKPKWETFKKIVFPYFYEYDFDFVVNPDKHYNEIFESAFGLNKKQIINHHYPRNSIFDKSYQKFKDHNLKEKLKVEYTKIIAFFPTFRANYDYNPFKFNSEKQSVEFIEWLENQGIVILFKNHKENFKNKILSSERVIDITSINMDIQEALLLSNCLISDYSSVIFDFKVTGKPICFFALDADQYPIKERNLYLNPKELKLSYYAYDWKNLQIGIETIFSQEKQSIEPTKKFEYINSLLKIITHETKTN